MTNPDIIAPIDFTDSSTWPDDWQAAHRQMAMHFRHESKYVRLVDARVVPGYAPPEAMWSVSKQSFVSVSKATGAYRVRLTFKCGQEQRDIHIETTLTD